jgi:hypothetical protein
MNLTAIIPDRNPPFIPFVQPQTRPSLVGSNPPTSSPGVGNTHRHISASGPEHHDHVSPLFRHRLDSALDILRSPSPLFADHDGPPPRQRRSTTRSDSDFEDSSLRALPRIPTPSYEWFPWRMMPSPLSESFSPTDERPSHSLSTAATDSTRQDGRSEPERDFHTDRRHGRSPSVAVRHRTNADRAREIEREADVLLEELRSIRDSFSARSNTFARRSASRPSTRRNIDPESATSTDRGLSHMNEDRRRSGTETRTDGVPLTRRGTFPTRLQDARFRNHSLDEVDQSDWPVHHPRDDVSPIRQRARQLRQSFDDVGPGDRQFHQVGQSNNRDSSDSEWSQRRSQILRLNLQGRPLLDYDLISGWRAANGIVFSFTFDSFSKMFDECSHRRIEC